MTDRYGYATPRGTQPGPPPLVDYDAFTTDPTLRRVVETYGAQWARDRLVEAGRTVVSARVQSLARAANRTPPELLTHDRFGNRIDQIEFHPAWHEADDAGDRAGDPFPRLDGGAARRRGRPRPPCLICGTRGENGIMCPIGMTYAAIPLLRIDSCSRCGMGAQGAVDAI